MGCSLLNTLRADPISNSRVEPDGETFGQLQIELVVAVGLAAAARFEQCEP